MRKGRVSDCILTSSHLIPVASAHAIWRVPRLVCVPPQNPHSLHIAVIDALEAQEIKETGNEEG